MLIKFFILLIVTAVLIALAFSDSTFSGAVTLSLAGLSFQTNLPAFALFLFGILVAVYLTVKILKLPQHFKHFFQRRKIKTARNALRLGLTALLRGDTHEAHKQFLQATAASDTKQIASLLAAYCSMRTNRNADARHELRQAYEADAEQTEAVSFAHARLFLQEGEYEPARNFLMKLRQKMPNNGEVIALFTRLALKSKDYGALAMLLPLLAHHTPGTDDEKNAQIKEAAMLLMRHAVTQGDAQMLTGAWRQLAFDQRDELLPNYARALDELGETQSAEKLLETAINTRQTEPLLATYGGLNNGDLDKRLKHAQHWRQQASNPDAIRATSLAIGMIYRRLKMPDKALEYLAAAYGKKPDDIVAHEIALAWHANTNRQTSSPSAQ